MGREGAIVRRWVHVGGKQGWAYGTRRTSDEMQASVASTAKRDGVVDCAQLQRCAEIIRLQYSRLRTALTHLWAYTQPPPCLASLRCRSSVCTALHSAHPPQHTYSA
jgi:hypothetical protein